MIFFLLFRRFYSFLRTQVFFVFLSFGFLVKFVVFVANTQIAYMHLTSLLILSLSPEIQI